MASAGGASQKMITLMGSDGVQVMVEEAAAIKSQFLRFLIEDNCAYDIIPFPNIISSMLSKVFDYCKKHVGEDPWDEYAPKDKDLKEFDDKFVNVDVNTLYDLLMAANFLEVKELLKLVCQKIASIIHGKSPEEIRQIFNIKNDLTPEEEEEIRKENPWAFK